MSTDRRPQLLLVTLIAAIAVIGAFVLADRTAGSASAAPVAAAPDAGVRGFSAPGTGTVTAVPDQLSFKVSITHHADDSVAAMNQTSASVTAVRKALTKAGVARKDINTTTVRIEPTYRYSNGRQIPTGFSSTQGLRVLVRDLPKAGAVLAKAAEAVANSGRIDGIAMEIGDRSALLDRARAEAMKDSLRAATAYADATGHKVGSVLYVDEVTSQPVSYGSLARSAQSLDALAASKVPIEAGEQDVTVRVKVRWAID